jgi:DNA-binding NarL/FixJ family response regulator
MMQLNSETGHVPGTAGRDSEIQHRAKHKGPAQMKVFVVEDSAAIRERLVEMIDEIDGFAVVGVAGTYEGAVSGITRARPDVAILDIQLASGSGIDALAQAKRSLPGLRAIILTNYATPQHEKAAADAGADYFLDKSADFEKIAEILQSMSADQNGAPE